jgi:uncharacterized membrane protein
MTDEHPAQLFVRQRGRIAHTGTPVTICYVVVALVLGANGHWLDALIGADVSPLSSASALAVLSAIAAGMMALTAIVFSLVLVAVQYAGTAYSPRLIRVVGARPFFAHALGIFTGTFVYALLALRSVDIAGRTGINASMVWISFLWVLASVAALVRMVARIRAFTLADVLVALERRASTVAARVYPSENVTSTSPASAPDLPVAQTLLHDQRPQYLVGLDVPRLVQAASAADGLIVIPIAIGGLAAAGDRLAAVLASSRRIADHELRAAIWLADDRTIENDPAYAIRLLVDIAIRALSPAVNDPTTAVDVLDELDGILRVLGRRGLENNRHTDEHGVVRLVRAVPTWDELVALALTEIDQYGRDSVQVERRITTLARNVAAVLPSERRAALERYSARTNDVTRQSPRSSSTS